MAKNFFQDLEEEKSIALNIIDPEPAEEEPAPQETTRRTAPRRSETKSRRMQILLKPSLYDKLRRISDAEGISINALINEIIEGYKE